MAIPKKYSDLGKSANDLFVKNYRPNEFTITYEAPPMENGLSYLAKGTRDLTTGTVSCTLDIITKARKYGLTVTEKWDLKNVLTTEVAVQDKPVSGLSLAAEGSFEPYTGKRSGALRVGYKMPNLHTTAKLDLSSGPSLTADVVAGYNSFFAGCSTTYDAKAGTLSKSSVSAAYDIEDITVATTVDSSKVSASIFHRLNWVSTVALQFGWSKATRDTSLAFVFQKVIAPHTAWKAKIDTKGTLGFSYVGTANNAFDYNGTVEIDTANLNSGNHKVGGALYFFHE